MEFKHIPIMLNEIISGLNINPDGVYVDCTIGGGGHSGEILKNLSNNGCLYGIDKDIDAINACKKRLGDFKNLFLVNDDFKNIKNIFENNNIDKIDGVLIDLGVSSYQIDNGDRGFSFNNNGPLDMRMNKSQDFSAYEVVNNYKEDRLVKIFYEYGEEQFSRQIAKNIIKAREIKPIKTTFELKEIIENSIPKKILFKKGGASKKVFQAIRIEVNGELDRLDETLEFLISKLKKGGRICVLSFHSLEDRIVKNIFKKHTQNCICPPEAMICTCNHKSDLGLVTKKPLVAGEEEIKNNSRSTCAKLRVAQKL